MMSKESLLREIKSQSLPVVICGAGVVGKTLLSILRAEGIEVACFCDNSEKVAQSRFCNLDVFQTANLRAKYPEAVVVVSVAAIRDAVDRLLENGYPPLVRRRNTVKDCDLKQELTHGEIDTLK